MINLTALSGGFQVIEPEVNKDISVAKYEWFYAVKEKWTLSLKERTGT